VARVSSTWLLFLIVVLGAGSLRAADEGEVRAAATAADADPAQPLSWLKSGDYPALESYYSQQQTRYEAGAIPDDKLYASFRKLYEDSPDNEGSFDRWIAAYPNSYAAVLARGVYLYRMAWAVRGDRYLNDTSSPQIEAMNNYLRRARPDLIASLKLTDKPYLSTLYLFNVAMLNGTSSERAQWYERGTALDPDNTLLRYRYMFSLRPRWGGSYGKMQGFLDQCEKDRVPPRLLARLAMLIHADLAEDAMRRADTQKTFDEWQEVLSLATQAQEEPGTEALIGFTRAAQDLNRPADAQRGLKLLDGRNPEDAWSQGRLGWIYVNAHQDEKAWTFLMRAAEQNDPWAQFVIGHSTYDGLPTLKRAPDQQAGLVWIRRSAAQCFPEAVQFLAARGEKQTSDCKRRSSADREWWVRLIPIGVGLLTSLVTSLIAASRKRKSAAGAGAGAGAATGAAAAGASGQSTRLQYPAIVLVIGILVVGFFTALAVLSIVYDNGTGGPAVSALFAAFGVLGLLMLLEYARARHELTPEGLEFGRLLGPRGSLKWRDVTRLTYSKGMRWFRIETASGAVARISAMLTGLPEFAHAVLEYVPSYALDAGAREVLEACLQGELPRLAS
jgi:TPR repeat protein